MSSNRLMNKVSGKRKRGGQKLKERSVICRIICEDGSCYSVLSCMKGILVEINTELINNPQLITQDPWGRGFIAIIITRLDRVKEIKSKLLSKEGYDKVILERNEVATTTVAKEGIPVDESSASSSSSSEATKKIKTQDSKSDVTT